MLFYLYQYKKERGWQVGDDGLESGELVVVNVVHVVGQIGRPLVINVTSDK